MHESPDGNITYEMKRQFSDGRRVLRFTPREFPPQPRGGNEEHAVECESRRCLARHCQLPLVNRIEGAAENRQFLGVRR